LGNRFLLTVVYGSVGNVMAAWLVYAYEWAFCKCENVAKTIIINAQGSQNLLWLFDDCLVFRWCSCQKPCIPSESFLINI
jgi:uncharacterized membrane protein YeaQ/YmgE (transglycosylase-associated protein family)